MPEISRNRQNARYAEDVVNVKDFGAVGDGVTDDTAAIQAAIDYQCNRSQSVNGYVYIPQGEYRITSTITTSVIGVGQCGIRGDGQFSTRLKPDGDFTAVHYRTSYLNSGDFSIEWPLTSAAAIPSSRIGIEFGDEEAQFAYSLIENITVMYAYRGYVLLDNSAGSLGTTYLSTLKKLTAFRCADYGIHINSKTGSTTLKIEQCYIQGSDSSGSAYGKGIYLNNVNEVELSGLALDLCLNEWLYAYNGSILRGDLALESCYMDNASSVALNINCSIVQLNGVKLLGADLDTGGNARIIFLAGNTEKATISGYKEQGVAVAGGTTKYTVAFGSSSTRVYVPDQSIPYSEISDNGFYHQVSHGGRFYSRTASAPSLGTWERGDTVYNRLPSVDVNNMVLSHWVCTVAGTPGTWTPQYLSTVSPAT